MTITTKYNPGEEVWIIYGSKVHLISIKSIQSWSTVNDVASFSYHFVVSGNNISLPENKVFKTKEELLKSL